MTKRVRIWGLSMWALVGMPVTFAFLFQVGRSIDEVPESIGLGVMLLCLASGVISINVLPLWTSLTRLLLSVVYIFTMPFALVLVGFGLACEAGACY